MTALPMRDSYVFKRLTQHNGWHSDASSGAIQNYLAYVIKGTFTLCSPYEEQIFTPGDFFFIPIGYSYESFWRGDGDVSLISLGFSYMPSPNLQHYTAQGLMLSDTTKEKFFRIPTDTEVTAGTLSLFYEVLSEIIPGMQMAQSPEASRLEKISKCIRDNPTLKIPEIARQNYVSQSYLFYLFKKHLQQTPNEYRMRVLCEKAERLLSNTDKKTEEIADLFGISSASYLRKLLKKYTGQTPKEIRKKGLL